MSKRKVNRSVIESHLEREYERSHSRRLNTHDLLNKVFSVHISIFLAVLAASGYLFNKVGDHVKNDVRLVIVALLLSAIAIGIVFYISIINIHISREYYRAREKILYVALRKLLKPKYDWLKEEKVNRLLDDYESFSRFHLTEEQSQWQSNWKSLFNMYRTCIYFTTGILSWLLFTNILSTTSCDVVRQNNWLLALPCIVPSVFIQNIIGKHFVKKYLLSHRKERKKVITYFDTPNAIQRHWKRR